MAKHPPAHVGLGRQFRANSGHFARSANAQAYFGLCQSNGGRLRVARHVRPQTATDATSARRQRDQASLLVDLPRDEMALLIEVVVDLGVNCAKHLQRLHASKPLHRPFASPKRLMRIFRAIVERTATSWRSALPISFIAEE